MSAKKYFYFFLLPMIIIYITALITYNIMFDGEYMLWWVIKTTVYSLLIFIFGASSPCFFVWLIGNKPPKKLKYKICAWCFCSASFFTYVSFPDDYNVIQNYDVDYMSQNLQRGTFKFIYKNPINTRDKGRPTVIDMENNQHAYLSCALVAVGCGDVGILRGDTYHVRYYQNPPKLSPQKIIFEIEGVANKNVQFYIAEYKQQQATSWLSAIYYASLYILSLLSAITYLIKE